MASGRQVDYDLRLNSNAAQILNRDSAAAAKFDNSMWQVQKTLASVGLGLGAHFLIDAAKDWTQAAADYETSMLRIKNASHEGFGVLNQDFIKKQVETFKIGLQESADAYGKFLFFVRNAPYSNDTLNRMYTDILTVSKVAGLPQESIDAAINNTAKMLSEGILEGRTLRQLSRVHAPLIPFLADAMGLKSGVKDEFSAIINNDSMDEKTMNQKLSFLISSGKLTKAALDPSVLIKAWDEYAKSVQEKLPETLNTIQSHLTDLSNTWLKFKNSMVLDQKPELLEFFKELESGIKWLSVHEESILKTGKAIFDIVELYAGWRIALMALQAPAAIVGFLSKEQMRLNASLMMYVPIQEKVAHNQEIINSQKSVLSNIEKIETQNIINYTTSIEEQEIELAKLSKSLEQVSVQMDLFTDAQIVNGNAFFNSMKNESWYKERLISMNQDFLNKQKILNNQYVENEIEFNEKVSLLSEHQYNKRNKLEEDYYDRQNIIQNELSTLRQAKLIEEKELIEGIAILEKERFDSLSKNTYQGSLFTDMEIEMSSAVKTSGEALALENEQLNLRKRILQESLALGDANMVHSINKLETMKGNTSIINPYSTSASGIIGSFSSAMTTVFIAGMAIEVADQMFPQGKLSGKSLGWSDWLYGAATISNPSLWFGQTRWEKEGHGFGKVREIAEENAKFSNLQNLLKLGESDLTKNLPQHGNYLYNLLSQSNLLDKIDPKDPLNAGKRQMENEQVFQLMRKVGLDMLDYVIIPDANKSIESENANKSIESKNANKLIDSQKTNHLKGNSITNINIHINELNGMKNSTFKEVDGVTINQVKNEVGIEITRMMLEIINDSQIVRSSHA